jgi:hypothetical protein
MRDFARVLILLLVLHFASATRARAYTSPFTKADENAYAWCISHFLSLDDEDPQPDKEILPIARPAAKLRPFDIKEMLVPPGLITETEIVGRLPPEIEKYRGLWITPTIDAPSLTAIFVERLTPTEMIIALARRKPDPKASLPPNPDDPRSKLKWNGNVFNDVRGVGYIISISPDGEAMFLIAENEREAMPVGCLISSKHY